MFDKTDVTQVRNDIKQIIGSTVQLDVNKGRPKAEVNRGVVSNVYPSIFTVKLGGRHAHGRHMSFSYTD
ncbi:MAG: Veg family protein, partial [Defluviitaleaceae bacterium]|nr:Veg family protein [Defluviitaleaceae bacterium]